MAIAVAGEIVKLFSKGLSSIFDYKSNKIQAKLKERGIDLDEKKLEAMLEVTETEFQKFVLENSLEIDSSFRDFVTEYEGAAKDVHPAVQVLRAIIRPAITLWAVGIISFLMFSNPDQIEKVANNMAAIPDKLWDIFFIVFAFWFGGRAVQHIIDKYTRNRVDEAKEVSRADTAVAIEETKREKVRAEAGMLNEKPHTHFTDEEVDEAMRGGRRKRRRFGPFSRKR